MTGPKPRNEEERKEFHREAYEIEKKDLTMFYNSQGRNKNGLNRFLANSLKADYADELKEDGLL